MNKKTFNAEDYQTYLETLNRADLLQELYETKRSKYPEKHRLIEAVLAAKVQPDRAAVQSWVDTLPGTSIVLKGYQVPIEIREAQMNAPATAAIVTLVDGAIKYLKYKGEKNE